VGDGTASNPIKLSDGLQNTINNHTTQAFQLSGETGRETRGGQGNVIHGGIFGSARCGSERPVWEIRAGETAKTGSGNAACSYHSGQGRDGVGRKTIQWRIFPKD